MPNYNALKSYLAAHPGQSDAQLTAAYAAETVVVRRSQVPVDHLRVWGATSGAREKIDDAATSGPPGVRSVALSVEDFLAGGGSPMDLDSPNIRAGLDALVAAGVLSAAQEASLLALGDAAEPRYSQPGEFGVPATAADFAWARRG